MPFYGLVTSMLAAVYDVIKMAGGHARSQGTREIVPLRARTLSVIEIYHNEEVSTAFWFLVISQCHFSR